MHRRRRHDLHEGEERDLSDKSWDILLLLQTRDKCYKTFMTSLTDSPIEFEPQKICTIYAYNKSWKFASVNVTNIDTITIHLLRDCLRKQLVPILDLFNTLKN